MCLVKIIENQQLEEILSLLSKENFTLNTKFEVAEAKAADLEIKLMGKMTKVIQRKEQSDVKIELLNFKLDNVS